VPSVSAAPAALNIRPGAQPPVDPVWAGMVQTDFLCGGPVRQQDREAVAAATPAALAAVVLIHIRGEARLPEPGDDAIHGRQEGSGRAVAPEDPTETERTQKVLQSLRPIVEYVEHVEPGDAARAPERVLELCRL